MWPPAARRSSAWLSSPPRAVRPDDSHGGRADALVDGPGGACSSGPSARSRRSSTASPHRSRALPLGLADRGSWDRTVLAGVRTLGWGEVTSYGRLARSIGRRGAARAVGGAVGRNPIGLAIPCHRVIAGDGTIGGYGGDWFGSRDDLLAIKRELLAREGVTLPTRNLRD